MICALCHSNKVFLKARIPDNRDIFRDLYECSICAALTPNYEISSILNIKDQIEFHEKLWEVNEPDSLQRELSDLIGLVKSLEPHLGVPAPDRRVLEIGAGRGGLLKALRDVGYNAHGCEPSANLVAIGRSHYSLPADILFNTDANSILMSINYPYNSIILWHIIEHLNDPLDILRRVSQIVAPDGAVIVQVPLLRKDYIFPEHYFFCSHKSLDYIAKEIGFYLAHTIYDEENLYVTAIFRRDANTDAPAFLDCVSVPDPLSQILLLNERYRQAREDAMRERAVELAAWKKLAEERLIAIEAMEQLINSGVAGMAAQAAMIDQRDLDIKALQQRLSERR